MGNGSVEGVLLSPGSGGEEVPAGAELDEVVLIGGGAVSGLVPVHVLHPEAAGRVRGDSTVAVRVVGGLEGFGAVGMPALSKVCATATALVVPQLVVRRVHLGRNEE